MRRRLFKRQKGNGFTLIELLIVMLIVGLLVTIAAPQYQKLMERVKWAEAANTLGVIRKAGVLYYAEYGIYPNVDGKIVILNDPNKGKLQSGGGGPGGEGDYTSLVNSLTVDIPARKDDGRFVYGLYNKDWPSVDNPCCAYAAFDNDLSGYQNGPEPFLKLYYSGDYESNGAPEF